MTYERITFTDKNGTHSHWADVSRETPGLVFYRRYTKTLGDFSYYDSQGTLHERIYILAKERITKREPARVNPTSAEMEVTR